MADYMVDIFADAVNTIKTNERIGRRECVIPSTKFIRAVMSVMKDSGYITGFEEFADGKFKKLRVSLSNRINRIGVIKPRFAVTNERISIYESRYVPSRDFGIVIMSTPKGLMTSREARERGFGGRMIAYMY
jgi:small subunit ribosomal protein S8